MDAKEEHIYIAVIATVVVLGIIIIYFVISLIRQQKRNLELQKANALAEITAMEKERMRIAADLHDDLGPILSVIKFQVNEIETASEEEKQQLAKASEHLDNLIGRMREIANNLMPTALRRKGLIKAAEEFFDRTEATSGLQIEFSHSGPVEISEDKSINIFRALQEVVHNCIKHAGAKKLEVRLKQKNKTLELFCRDNGKGFDYEKNVKESEGIGLRSLINRTEMMGGKLTAESKAGKGTAFLIEIPV
jgi:two-component system NarL family sensor kinase